MPAKSRVFLYNQVMLNQRSRFLLKTLVERYIADGQPVGSRTLAKVGSLELSPASIRNVMADLEEMGLIASPHTSAGRIPTPRGFRLFVDSLLVVQPMARNEQTQMQGQLEGETPQALVANASKLLSDLTRFAGVVMTPKRHISRLRQVEFLPLSERRILLILVTEEGEVQNRILNVDRHYRARELQEAAQYLNAHCSGQTLAQVEKTLHHELQRLQSDITTLMGAVLSTCSHSLQQEGDYVMHGEHNLLQVDELTVSSEKLRRLFAAFDQKTALKELLAYSETAEGVQIFIGGESGLVPVEDCSVVTAPYQINGQVMGTLGVIGPTRMAYDKVIPIVDLTAKLLSSALAQQMNTLNVDE